MLPNKNAADRSLAVLLFFFIITDPYRVVIPSMIDGRRVSTLGRECLGAPYAGDLLELTVSEGITTILL